MPVVKWASIASMAILIPPKAVLEPYQKIVSPMLQQIKSFHFINQHLAHARDLLLPRLVNGALVV